MNRKGVADLIIIIALVSVLLGSAATYTYIQSTAKPQTGTAKTFESCTALASAFNQSYGQYGGYYRSDAVPTAAGMEDSAKSESNGAGSGSTPQFSETNVQVSGVDEADIVKTDGTYIYTLSPEQYFYYYDYAITDDERAEGGKIANEYVYREPEHRGPKLVIAQAYPADEMKIMSETEFENFTPQEMFVQGDTLVIFGQKSVYYPMPTPYVEGGAAKMMMPYYPYYISMTSVQFWDVSDRSDPQHIRTLEFEGGYFSSRKIGDQLYFVINSYPRYQILERDVDNGSGIIPLYSDTEEGEELKPACGCDEVVHFEPVDARQFITVVSMSIADPQGDVKKEVIVGSGQNLYMSTENLYIAEANYPTYAWGWDGPVRAVSTGTASVGVDDTASGGSEGSAPSSEGAEDDENVTPPDRPETPDAPDEKELPEEQEVNVPSDAEVIAQQQVTTIVYKFALNDGDVSYTGSMEFPGTVLNQFSMDENEGYFRVATTTQAIWSWRTGKEIQKEANGLYVFSPDMEQTGAIEDIAPGESIYSVRFMGDRAYMVTFKRIDPLFVIDLSDPSNPSILGKLKIPGYSDYLHPYDENHIIGIGKEVVEGKTEDGLPADFAWQQGVKLALFDVTDVEHPVEMYKTEIGDRGTDSEALYEHKAFLFDREKGLLVIPITLAELTDKQKEYGEEWEYGEYVYQGAYVYSLTLEEGFDLRGRITHIDDQETFDKMGYWYYSNQSIKRSLYIGDSLYTISDTVIKANDLGNLEEISKVGF